MRSLPLWFAVACRSEPTSSPSSDADPEDPSGPPSTPTPDTTPATTGDTGAPSTTTVPFDCSALPTGPFPVTTYDIQTTEDFDFDALGNLVYTDMYFNVLASDIYGATAVVGPTMGDSRGIQVLSDGDIAMVYVDVDALTRTDRASGFPSVLLSGLRSPNAMDVGDGDLLYITETTYDALLPPRVISFDPATSAVAEVARGFTFPNGIALNEAQDTLYVGDTTSGLLAVHKDAATGGWGRPEVVYDPTGRESIDAIETDICGNVYVVQFNDGELSRIDPVTHEREVLTNVEIHAEERDVWNAIRWGSGRGGWRRDVLYVTDRKEVFGVEIGVPGRSQPVDLAP